MRIHVLSALGLIALLTVPAGATAGAVALGTGCSGSGNAVCSFTCLPGEQIFVGASDGETVVATCGGATIGCTAPPNGQCIGRSTPVLFAGRGTCVGVGTGNFGCGSS